MLRRAAAVLAPVALLLYLVRRRRRRIHFDFDTIIDRRGRHAVKTGPHDAGVGGAQRPALPLWVADMDLPICPHIQAAISERAAHPIFGYTIQPAAMWAATSAWLRERHSWDVAPDAFVFSATVVSSFCNLLHLLTAPDDAVLVMTPLYAPLQASVTGSGRRLVCHSLHRGDDDIYRIDRPGRSLEQTLDDERVRLVLLCNPQNPTGRVWSEAELESLCSRCARRSIPIVSDEIWMDWTLFGARHTPLAPVGARCGCEVVTLGAPTKTWALAGLHSSWLAFGDAAMKARYVAKYEPTSQLYGSTFATEATLAAYTQGGPWLAAAKAYIEANLEYVVGFLAAHVPAVPVTHQAAGDLLAPARLQRARAGAGRARRPLRREGADPPVARRAVWRRGCAVPEAELCGCAGGVGGGDETVAGRGARRKPAFATLSRCISRVFS